MVPPRCAAVTNGRCCYLISRVSCRDYVAFEFLALSGRFTRHVVAAATVANGKLILFTIGSSEKRWSKMKDKLATSVRSFKAFDIY